jgi:hypothetical protein
MTDKEQLDVPMAWLWAEQAGADLITHTDSSLSPATFEFRAARDVLALTMLLAGIASRADDLSASQLEFIRDLLSAGGPWLDWCDSRLDVADPAVPDLRLARQAWQWLLRGQLLLAPQQADLAPAFQAAARPGAGCRIGLKQARRVIGAHLTGLRH